MKGKKMPTGPVRHAVEVGCDAPEPDAIQRARQILARLQRLNLRLGRVDNELGRIPCEECGDEDRPRSLMAFLDASQRELHTLEASVSSIERKLVGSCWDNDCEAYRLDNSPEDD